MKTNLIETTIYLSGRKSCHGGLTIKPRLAYNSLYSYSCVWTHNNLPAWASEIWDYRKAMIASFTFLFFFLDSLTMEHWSQTAVSHMLHLYAFALSSAALPPPPPLDNFVKSVLFHEFKATLWPQNNLMYCSIMFEFWLMNLYIFKFMYFPYLKDLHVEETRYI